jgi:tetratricopeptide (TPR) repeat protein
LQIRLQLELATLTAHAAHQFSKASELLDDLMGSAHLGELAGHVLLEHGYCLLHTSKLEKSEQDIRRGLGFVRDRNQRLNIAKGLQYLGMVKSKQNDPIALEDACQHLLEAAQVAKGVPGQLSQIADSLGRAFSRRGKYDMATRWFNSSIKKKRELGDLAGMAISYGGLGEANLRAGQFTEATRAYEEDLQMVQKLEPVNFVQVGILLCLLVECSRRQRDLRQADNMLAQADRILPRLGEVERAVSEAYIGTYRARLRYDEKEYQAALQLLLQAEGQFIKAEYESFLPAVRRGIGEAQIQLDDLEAAKRVLEWAEVHESDPYEKRFIYENLTQLAKRHNDQDGLMRYAAQTYFLNEQLPQAPAADNALPASAGQVGKPQLQAQIEILNEIPSRVLVGETLAVELQVRQLSGEPMPAVDSLCGASTLVSGRMSRAGSPPTISASIKRASPCSPIGAILARATCSTISSRSKWMPGSRR